MWNELYAFQISGYVVVRKNLAEAISNGFLGKVTLRVVVVSYDSHCNRCCIHK